MRILFIIFFLVFFPEFHKAQIPRFRFMEYNVENLFDCKNDSLKNDDEFLPTSLRQWTYSRYRDKLLKLMKVIVAVGKEQLPDMIALCEVENKSVIRDLTCYTPLKVLGYHYVITDSPDERGINVALLYQPFRFRLLSYESIKIPPLKDHRPTRDILHVVGLIATMDTIDVFVCHFPSRATGTYRSLPYRMHVAQTLKNCTDSIMNNRLCPYILITGDFNEEPYGKPFKEVLKTSSPKDSINPKRLYNLMEGLKPGTYRYQGEWNLLDQFIVSGTLLIPTALFRTHADAGHIVTFPFLLEVDSKYGGYKPFRTYLGPRYKGGYSDHLPIYVDFELYPKPVLW